VSKLLRETEEMQSLVRRALRGGAAVNYPAVLKNVHKYLSALVPQIEALEENQKKKRGRKPHAPREEE